jgi:hypothetical protein
MTEGADGIVTAAVNSQEEGLEFLEKMLDVAQPERVFGPPQTYGEYTIITASEALAGVGYGFAVGGGEGTMEDEEGSGNGSGGGGGGGGGAWGGRVQPPGGGDLGRPARGDRRAGDRRYEDHAGDVHHIGQHAADAGPDAERQPGITYQ